MLAIAIGFIVGVILPMQTSINSRLRLSVGSPFVASFVSFTVGTLLLMTITLLYGGSILIPGSVFQNEPFWIWSGGVLGVIFITGNILLFPKLGSVQTVIIPILGQIIMGLLIDHFGWFNASVNSISPSRILGALLVIIGVIGTIALPDILKKRSGTFEPSKKSPELWIWRIIGVMTGMVSAMSVAVNGHLGVALGSSFQAAFVSFLVGAVALLLILLFVRPDLSLIKSVRGAGLPWWAWFGGFIGATFVTGNVYIVPIIGAGVSVIVVILGLIVGSLLIDRFGLFGAARNPITPVQFLSLLIMVTGVAVIRLI